MTPRDDFELLLTEWMRSRAPRGAPDDLLEAVLDRTARTRRRPPWLIAERWLPMQLTLYRTYIPRRATLFVVLALVVALALAAQLAIGSRPKLPAPFGVAGNGLIAFDAGGQIVVAKPDGSTDQAIPSSFSNTTAPSWSPDGSRVAYWSQPVHNGPSKLVVANADGTQAHVVSADLAVIADVRSVAKWSQDGNRLAFTSIGDGPEPVYLASADGSGIDRLGGDELSRSDPEWAPDGQWLSFIGKVPFSQQYGLYVARPDGTDEHLLPTSPGSGFAFQGSHWAPDPTEERLLYYYGDDGGHDIGMFDLKTGHETTVSADPLYDEFWPIWSPDGKQVAFTSMDNDMRIVNADGTGLRRLPMPLLDPQFNANWMVWSPDGKEVAAFDRYDHAVAILLVDGSGSPKLVPAPGAQTGSISWQRVAP